MEEEEEEEKEDEKLQRRGKALEILGNYILASDWEKDKKNKEEGEEEKV